MQEGFQREIHPFESYIRFEIRTKPKPPGLTGFYSRMCCIKNSYDNNNVFKASAFVDQFFRVQFDQHPFAKKKHNSSPCYSKHRHTPGQSHSHRRWPLNIILLTTLHSLGVYS